MTGDVEGARWRGYPACGLDAWRPYKIAACGMHPLPRALHVLPSLSEPDRAAEIPCGSGGFRKQLPSPPR